MFVTKYLRIWIYKPGHSTTEKQNTEVIMQGSYCWFHWCFQNNKQLFVTLPVRGEGDPTGVDGFDGKLLLVWSGE